MKVTHLGHAGLKVETARTTLLCDPWFSPEGAFQASWFQYPNNSHLLGPAIGSTPAYSVEVSPVAYPDVGPLARARATRASLEALFAELDELGGRLD